MIKNFQDLTHNRTLSISIVGMGYVGIPLASAFSRAGFNVIGVDTNIERCETLNKGLNDLGAGDNLALLLTPGSLRCHSDFSILNDVDVVILCLPTPIGEHQNPELTIVEAGVKQVLENVKKGTCVILESTTYPGTTRELIVNAAPDYGFNVGEDFFVAYSPEREDPGNKKFNTNTTPKLVGGYDQLSLDIASTIYATISEVVPCDSMEIAEAAKLLENIFRSVNISLVNELKIVLAALDIDIWKVIDAASSKPFGFMPFYPGPGIGGHCIPVDPFYLSWIAKTVDTSTRFINLAGEINDAMPEYVVTNVISALNIHRQKCLSLSKILVIGAAYKADIGDFRESPAITILSKLIKNGATIDVVDPFIAKDIIIKSCSLNSVIDAIPLRGSNLLSYDLVLILTAHSDLDYTTLVNEDVLIVDTRGVCDKLVTKSSKSTVLNS